MITLEHITKVYGQGASSVEALKDVNLHVAKGSISGVIGLSGAGKSTLIRCVNLLERPTSGKVTIDGTDLTQLDASGLRKARHGIGMIFQHFNLLESRTVAANIALPLELMKRDKNSIRNRVDALLTLTGLSGMGERYPSQLSGGQKQRVAIARALASEPKVLLCDEATSALDPHTTRSILELLKEINQQLGLTILLITHEMDVVKAICDQVSLIEGGELVETAPIGAFFTHPETPAGRHFISDQLELAIPASLSARLLPSDQLSASDHTASTRAAHPVVRLTFSSDNVTAPLISQLAREHDLDISIIEARVESIQTHTLGLMIAELMGDSSKTDKVITQLKERNMHVEVLGHVL
ncbi:Methionine import ATP-binding protein MetN [Halomonadaceae bacterium LMG 33818]|uniref:methionine ABC transporter ATP-binding protein n=1 Tax=Cernens ardua TaxID=3402176 RepID=UPI003EDC3FEC